MLSRLIADALLLLHVAFVLFVVLGGLLVVRWPRFAWVHVPCALWGALVEFAGWICPLTPWEQQLRSAAGRGGYSGGFIEHYIVPLVYPGTLTREIQVGLGLFVLGVNAAVYAWTWHRHRCRPRR